MSPGQTVGLVLGSLAILCGLGLIALALRPPSGKARSSQSGFVVVGALLAAGGLAGVIASVATVPSLPGDRPILTVEMMLCTVVLFLCAALAAASGTGGGALYTAALISIPQFSAHQAMPLAYTVVLGCAVGSFGFLAKSVHPNPLAHGRPLIDFLLCLIIEPMTLMGTIFGLMLNLSFPSYMIVIVLVCVLVASAWRTLSKGVMLFRQEKAERDAALLMDSSTVSSTSEQQRLTLVDQRFPLSSSVTDLDPDAADMLEEESHFPWHLFAGLVAMWSGVAAILMLRGGGAGQPSIVGVQCGSWQYWVLVAAAVVFLSLVSALVGVYTHRLYKRKASIQFPFLQTDLRWPVRDLVVWPLVSIGVGVAAGFAGISGGMIQGPLLLHMGVLPQVAAATTSFLVLFTSSIVVLQYALLNMIDWRLGIWMFAVGLVAAFIGQTFLDAIMKKYRRQSFIAFLLSALIIVSGAVTLGMNIARLVDGTAHLSFGTPCQVAR